MDKKRCKKRKSISYFRYLPKEKRQQIKEISQAAKIFISSRGYFDLKEDDKRITNFIALLHKNQIM